MYFNPYSFTTHRFNIMQTDGDKPEYGILDKQGTNGFLICTDYTIPSTKYEVVADKISILGPEKGVPISIIISCFHSWITTKGKYFGDTKNSAQKPEISGGLN